MAGAFVELDWRRLDVWAIVAARGVCLLDEAQTVEALAWLQGESYEVLTLDFAQGLSPVVKQLGELFRWEEQFGYALSPQSRNLDTLADGFEVPFTETGRSAMVLLHFERARVEEAQWAAGFLELVSENSLRELALGRRFFALRVGA
jgi:hypothetical protein